MGMSVFEHRLNALQNEVLMTSPQQSYRGYVYLIGSSRFGWYKIGKSRKVNIRIENIGILLPFRIQIFAVWKSTSHDLVEKLFHEKYADKWINGEWFSLDKKELDKIIDAEPPFDAIRIYPSPENDEIVYGFSNMKCDIIKKPWEAEKVPSHKKIGAHFMELVAAWMDDNGLEHTPENKKAGRLVVAKLFRT